MGLHKQLFSCCFVLLMLLLLQLLVLLCGRARMCVCVCVRGHGFVCTVCVASCIIPSYNITGPFKKQVFSFHVGVAKLYAPTLNAGLNRFRCTV